MVFDEPGLQGKVVQVDDLRLRRQRTDWWLRRLEVTAILDFLKEGSAIPKRLVLSSLDFLIQPFLGFRRPTL
jgi:hypothetical protein